jgi:hypothetical protein
VQIAKAVGKVTASDVNPSLYALEKLGLIHRTNSFASKPHWKWTDLDPPKKRGWSKRVRDLKKNVLGAVYEIARLLLV